MAKAKKRKQLIRRTVFVVIALAVIIGISYAVTRGGGSKKASSTSTTAATASTASAKPHFLSIFGSQLIAIFIKSFHLQFRPPFPIVWVWNC